MRITSKGQVTIPQEIRNKAGLLPGVEVEFTLEGDNVCVLKSKPGDQRLCSCQCLLYDISAFVCI
jgi:AbrB family looped-hinge helix DNA binding protein